MIKRLLPFLLLILPSLAWSQVTLTASSGVTSSNGILYAQGTYSINLVSSTGADLTNAPLTVGGVTLSVPSQTGKLSATATFTITLPLANSSITSPTGTQYRLSICSINPVTQPVNVPLPPQVCFTYTATFNSSIDLSTTLSALAPPLQLPNGCPTVGCTFTGPINALSVNGVINATLQTGSDIGAQVNAAFTACSSKCAVFIPAGTYAQTTTISYPVGSLTGAVLFGTGPNTILNYTGSGDAIAALGTGQSQVGLTIRDLQITPASTATSAIHLKAFNLATIQNVMVKGASSGSTDCLLNEGANSITVISPNFSSCKNGIHDVGVVVSSVGYSANVVNVYGGQIFANTLWGRYEDGTQSATPGCNASNADFGVTYDFNGSGGSGGSEFLQCTLGFASFGNFFEYAAATTHTSEITLGDSTYQAKSTLISGNQFFSSGTVTETINDVNSSATVLVDNAEYGAVTNFYNHGTLSRNTYLAPGNLASAAGIFFTGSDTGSDTIGPCSTCVNGQNVSINGYAFNTISGYGNDLNLRERASSSGKVVNFLAVGGGNVGFVDNLGNVDALLAFKVNGTAITPSNPTGVTGTGNAVYSIAPAITGVTSGSGATAGVIGEDIASAIAVGSPVSLSTATPKTVTSISLTAGDWEVWGNCNFTASGATTALAATWAAGISTTTNTLPTDGSEIPILVPAITTTSFLESGTTSSKQIDVSVTTTVYLVCEATFTAGTVGGYGKIEARRMR